MASDDDNAAWELRQAALIARDALGPIVSGEIERGHCVGGREAYGAVPGKRKTTLKDARRIASGVVAALNKAVNQFDRP